MNGISIGAICTVTDHSAQLLGADSALGRTLRDSLQRTAEVCAEEAKRRTPVKTGNLRESIGYTVGVDLAGNPAAAVGTNVPYAAAHEFGTARIRAKHFLADGMAAGAASFGT